MAHERTTELLRSHRVRVAKALARQTRTLVPRYAQVESNALERSFLTLLNAVERLLSTGDARQLVQSAEYVAQLRAMTGFRIDDFTTAAVCFLPVLRRFILERATNLQEGLADYEAFEEVALPFIGRATRIFIAAEGDGLDDEVTAPSHAPLFPTRTVIERVVGDASEERAFDAVPFI